MTTPPLSHKGHRYPVEIINHCVWLYFRFPLSFREVEELMLEGGVVVSYETIRRWCAKFGQTYANQLRRRHTALPMAGGRPGRHRARRAAQRCPVSDCPKLAAPLSFSINVTVPIHGLMNHAPHSAAAELFLT